MTGNFQTVMKTQLIIFRIPPNPKEEDVSGVQAAGDSATSWAAETEACCPGPEAESQIRCRRAGSSPWRVGDHLLPVYSPGYPSVRVWSSSPLPVKS